MYLKNELGLLSNRTIVRNRSRNQTIVQERSRNRMIVRDRSHNSMRNLSYNLVYYSMYCTTVL